MIIKKVYSKRLKKNVWTIDVRVGGVRVRRGDFETRAKADEAITALKMRDRSELYGTRLRAPEVTLGELLEARLADPICNSTRNRKRLVGYFEEFVYEAGPRTPVREVTTARIREFRDRLFAERLKNSTIEFQMAGVTGSLNAARLYFPELETFRAPTLPGLVVESRSTLVPRQELRKLVNALHAPHKYERSRQGVADLLELLQLTGARVNELCTLERSQLDFERRLITLYGSKTHTKRVIPMSPTAERILRLRSKLPTYTAARQTLKIVAEQNKIEFGQRGWVIHDIRHTAASVLAERNISHSIIAALLGHRLGGMTAIYTHATLPALAQAVGCLEDYWLGEARRLHVVS